MNHIVPFVRAAGHGSPVICLHSSTASSKQWDRLMQQLGSKYRVMAPDLYGHGKSPHWPGAAAPSLAQEAQFIASAFDALPQPAHLVGHSYGGAIALKFALMFPERVRSLVLFEPVLFRLLADRAPGHRATAEAISVAVAVRRAVQAGRADVAAQGFIDYWTGRATWVQMDATQQQTIAARMRSVAGHFDAAFNDPTTVRELARLELPMLFLTGGQSRASTRHVSALLRHALPRAVFRELPAVGHMGPVSHAREINEMIQTFLDAQPDLVMYPAAHQATPEAGTAAPSRAEAVRELGMA